MRGILGVPGVTPAPHRRPFDFIGRSSILIVAYMVHAELNGAAILLNLGIA